MLQRMFKIGFNRAARIMDQLAEAQVVGPEEGTKPRKVLMTKEEFEEYLGTGKIGGLAMKTDIQIAQEAQMLPIKEVAANAGITEDDLEFYGKYKAKLSEDFWDKIKDNPDGKLVSCNSNQSNSGRRGKDNNICWFRPGIGQVE